MAGPISTKRRSSKIGLFEEMEAAIQERDMEAIGSCYHTDFEMKMYSNCVVITKEQLKEGPASIFKNSSLKEKPYAVSTKITTYSYLTQL